MSTAIAAEASSNQRAEAIRIFAHSSKIHDPHMTDFNISTMVEYDECVDTRMVKSRPRIVIVVKNRSGTGNSPEDIQDAALALQQRHQNAARPQLQPQQVMC